MKIVFVGAGSIVFVKNLVGDCMLTPALCDAEFALLDIDKDKLHLVERMLHTLNDNINSSKAVIKAYENQKDGLRDADFVITTIQVGGYDKVTEDFEIPLKYGLKQTFGDTIGIGGIMRGLRTIPVMLDILKDMEEVCPNAWLLNYTNPMAIITGALLKSTSIKTIGLCHSVQICADELLNGLNMDTDHISYHIAGINHQAWLLEITRNGVDIYPEIRRKAAERPTPHNDMVRYEIMKQFGYYVTESSLHSSEYMPYFIKNRYPELLGQFEIRTDMYTNWEQSRIDYWDETKKKLMDNTTLTHTLSREFASHIINAIVTDTPYEISANVLNKNYITNLPYNACVEVPCLVNGHGITPCFVGDLPTQCAALNQTNIGMQNLAIEAALTGKKSFMYLAAMLDPHTSAELSINDIHAMCDELLTANAEWIHLSD